MTIEQRLAALERSNRQLKAALAATLLSAAAIVCLGAAGADKPKSVVTAKSFSLVDDDGAPCGFFGFDKGGSAILSLHHTKQDKAAVVIAAQQTGGAIRLSPVGTQKTDRRGVYLYASGDAGCAVTISGADGTSQFSAP